MKEMTPRERVMTALRGGIPDRVPWGEAAVDWKLQVRLMEGRVDFKPAEFCRKMGMSCLTNLVTIENKGDRSEAQHRQAMRLFDFTPPWIAEMAVDDYSGRRFVRKGLLTTRDSLTLFDSFLPDPDDPASYEDAARMLEAFQDDFAVFARFRTGSASMLVSMGIDQFAYNVFDQPDFVKEAHRRFSEWSARVVEHLNKLNFDFYWVFDDLADTHGPWMDMTIYHEFFQPYQKMVADAIKKPWIFHSDGNILPILDGILTLGMDGIHSIQPSAMDINEVKRKYGEKICIIGNIDLDYTLTQGTPEEVDQEVKERINYVGRNGGYIISSANSLTEYCKTENVWAMAEAIKKYGKYPLTSVP